MEPLTPVERVRLAVLLLEGLPDWPALSKTYGDCIHHLIDLWADLDSEQTRRLS